MNITAFLSSRFKAKQSFSTSHAYLLELSLVNVQSEKTISSYLKLECKNVCLQKKIVENGVINLTYSLEIEQEDLDIINAVLSIPGIEKATLTESSSVTVANS